ncbi:MAG: hypothetical protein RIC95_11645 [Vicingaceae bacterium]
MKLLSKRYLAFLLSIPILLTIPFTAMLISSEVNWSFFDFVLMGFILLILSTVIELSLRLFKKSSTRLIIIALILCSFLLIWAELAVGVFGSPWAGS